MLPFPQITPQYIYQPDNPLTDNKFMLLSKTWLVSCIREKKRQPSLVDLLTSNWSCYHRVTKKQLSLSWGRLYISSEVHQSLKVLHQLLWNTYDDTFHGRRLIVETWAINTQVLLGAFIKGLSDLLDLKLLNLLCMFV